MAGKASHVKATVPSSAAADQVARLRAATEAMLEAGDGKKAIATLLDVVTSLHNDNARLLARWKMAVRARFGRRSEKLTVEQLGQLVLALGGTEQDASQPEPMAPVPAVPSENDLAAGEKSNPKPKKKRQLREATVVDPKVPRTVVEVAVPAQDRTCIHCAEAMTRIGYVDYEHIEFHPARFEVLVRRCEKIACKHCKQDICTAEAPSIAQAFAVAGAASSAASTPAAVWVDASKSAGAGGAEVVQATKHTGDRSAPADIHGGIAPPDVAATEPAAQAPPPVEPQVPVTVMRRVGPSLMAHLIESKCDDALPIYRQREQLRRYGVSFPLNTLYSYWMAGLRIVEPIASATLSTVLGSPIVGVDDTRLDFLDPDLRAQKQRGHLWCFVSQGDLVAFDFTESWCAEDIAPNLTAIDGFIQCDDYAGYSAFVQGSPLVDPARRLGCLMHVRRRFHKAFVTGEKDAIIGLSAIKSIYEIEARATEQRMGATERLKLRQNHALTPLEQFYTWVTGLRGLRRKSYLADAVKYAINQRPFIERCFTDWRFELDTGRVERQIREPAVGRKHYLFSGSPEAAKLLAGAYSIVRSCRNLGIPTRDYLLDVIPRLQAGFPLRRINELWPDQWATQRGILPSADYAE